MPENGLPEYSTGFLIFTGVVYLAACFWVGFCADNKGRSGAWGFFLALLTTPIVGGLLVGFLSTDWRELEERRAVKRQKVQEKPAPVEFKV